MYYRICRHTAGNSKWKRLQRRRDFKPWCMLQDLTIPLNIGKLTDMKFNSGCWMWNFQKWNSLSSMEMKEEWKGRMMCMQFEGPQDFLSLWEHAHNVNLNLCWSRGHLALLNIIRRANVLSPYSSGMNSSLCPGFQMEVYTPKPWTVEDVTGSDSTEAPMCVWVNGIYLRLIIELPIFIRLFHLEFYFRSLLLKVFPEWDQPQSCPLAVTCDSKGELRHKRNNKKQNLSPLKCHEGILKMTI